MSVLPPYWLRPEEQSSTSRVERLRGGGDLARARRIQESLGEVESTLTTLELGSSDTYATGVELSNFDRELRRAAAIVRHRGRLEVLPRPAPLRDGLTRIASSEVGSFEVVVDALGVVSMVLLSDPVQLLLTLAALQGGFTRIRAWIGARSDPLRRISARDAFSVIREFGAITAELGAPLTLEPKALRPPGSSGVGNTISHQPPEPTARIETLADVEEAGVSLTLGDGTVARGKRLIHIRNRRDGTTDIVVLE